METQLTVTTNFCQLNNINIYKKHVISISLQGLIKKKEIAYT